MTFLTVLLSIISVLLYGTCLYDRPGPAAWRAQRRTTVVLGLANANTLDTLTTL